MAPQITGEIAHDLFDQEAAAGGKKQQIRERKKQRRHDRKERQLQERKEQQLRARQKQQQLQQQFIAEFVRRLGEAPDGTRVYMRCGDVFARLAGCDDDAVD